MLTNPANTPMKPIIKELSSLIERIEDVKVSELMQRYPEEHVKILIGCAPCQPFSAYNKGMRNLDGKG